jgi:ABC-2 type transport system ATP-binding protein
VPPKSAAAAITACNVSKTFSVVQPAKGFGGRVRSFFSPERRLRTAVDDVSLTVEQGELVAFLGPNGAGKSTMIKMLTGIVRPTSGEIRIAGRIPHLDRERNARSIGVVFGQRTQLWWDLPARESLEILRDLYDVPHQAYRKRLEGFDEILDLSSFWNSPVRQLSLGQRVRCDLAAALLHDPQIVFLDEPTIGMDVVVKEQIREFLRREVSERGRTVVLTTHDMTEVAHLAERVALIDHGRIIFDGPIKELGKAYGSTPIVHVTFTEPVVEVVVVPQARTVSQDGLRATLRLDPDATRRQVIGSLIDRYPVADLSIEEESLEDLMRAVYLGANRVDQLASGGGS